MTFEAGSHFGAESHAAEFARMGAQYSEVQSISVNYVERTGTPARDTIIDRIDFRKNAEGKFELHIT